jgi:hypothetical protein
MPTLLSATAAGMSSTGTRSGTIAAHAGITNAAPTPRAIVNPMSTHGVTTSIQVRIPSVPATRSR